MQTNLFIRSLKSKRGVYAPAHKKTDFSLMSNESLKFALDILSLHHSALEVEAANEITKRIVRGTWLDIEKPVPTMADDVPAWLKVFPFSLLWKQRPR